MRGGLDHGRGRPRRYGAGHLRAVGAQGLEPLADRVDEDRALLDRDVQEADDVLRSADLGAQGEPYLAQRGPTGRVGGHRELDAEPELLERRAAELPQLRRGERVAQGQPVRLERNRVLVQPRVYQLELRDRPHPRHRRADLDVDAAVGAPPEQRVGGGLGAAQARAQVAVGAVLALDVPFERLGQSAVGLLHLFGAVDEVPRQRAQRPALLGGELGREVLAQQALDVFAQGRLRAVVAPQPHEPAKRLALVAGLEQVVLGEERPERLTPVDRALLGVADEPSMHLVHAVGDPLEVRRQVPGQIHDVVELLVQGRARRYRGVTVEQCRALGLQRGDLLVDPVDARARVGVRLARQA